MGTLSLRRSAARRHCGFTTIEFVIAIGLLAASAGMTIPMFRVYQAHVDIDTATDHLVQALRSAETLAKTGKADSAWGVYFPEGTLFSGDEYALRATDYDLEFTIPESIDISGLEETTYTKQDGIPTRTGDVHVTSSISAFKRTITIGPGGAISVSALTIDENAAAGGNSGNGDGSSSGDTGGDTGGTTDGSTGGETGGESTGGTTSGSTGGETGGTTGGSTSGTTGGETGGTTGGATSGSTGGETGGTTGGTAGDDDGSTNGNSGGGLRCGVATFDTDGSSCALPGQYPVATFTCYDGSEKTIDDGTCLPTADWRIAAEEFCSARCSGNNSCEKKFLIGADRSTVQSIGSNDVVFSAIGSDAVYAGASQRIAVRASVSTDKGRTWNDLFNGRNIQGRENDTVQNLLSSESILLRVNGRFSWLFNKTYRSDDSGGHIVALKNGDQLPDYPKLRSVATLPAAIKGVVDSSGKVDIDPKAVLFLVELGALDDTAQFEDLVLLATFEEKSGSCADTSKPRVKVSFRRVQNQGAGNAKPEIFVGPDSIRFAEEQWIPLQGSNGSTIVDSGIQENVAGLALERGNGWIKIVSHGSHPSAVSKEIVDARILFNHAYITSTENDTGQNATENPLDSSVSDADDGDEFVAGPNAKSMTFKTRVTESDDGVILHWVAGTPSEAATSSVASSSASSASSASSVAGVGDGCYVSHVVDPASGAIELKAKGDVSVHIRGADATYGSGGPKIGVRARISFDNGATWQHLNKGRALRGNELAIFRDKAAGSRILLEFSGRYGWQFQRTTTSKDDDGHVKVLKRGQSLSALTQSRNAGTMKSYLRSLLSASNTLSVTDRDTVIVVDLSNDQTKKYNDVVAVISIDKPASDGECTTQSSSSSSSTSTSSQSSAPSNPDADSDGILNADDWCPLDTVTPEVVPTEYMSFNRFALTKKEPAGSIPVFRSGPKKNVSKFSLEDTHGCSCSQILDAIDDKGVHRFGEHPVVHKKLKNLFQFVLSNSKKFGCSESLLQLMKEKD